MMQPGCKRCSKQQTYKKKSDMWLIDKSLHFFANLSALGHHHALFYKAVKLIR